MARSVNYEELDPSFLNDLPGFPLVVQLPMSGPDTGWMDTDVEPSYG